MNKMTKKELLKESLRNLGVELGDVIFLSADLMKVGYFNKNIETTLKDWVDILLELIGERGTIIIPANTDSFSRFNKKKNIVFKKDTPPNSGSLSTAFFKYATVLRSRHPTNSCFGVGPKAEYILNGHDENSLSYSLYGKIIELGGKNLMLGTVEDRRNSPMPFHYCQEILGHTVKHPSVNLHQCFYINEEGKEKIFTRSDIGGCTRGALNTFGEHIANKAIKFGVVGKSLSALVDTKKSYSVLMDVLENRPSLVKCSDRNCVSCYGRFIYNRFGVILFYIKIIPYLFKKVLYTIRK